MSDAMVVSKQELESDTTRWAAKASTLQIVDRETYLNASQFLRSIKGLRSQVQAWFAPHIEAAMETKRKAEAARKALADERDRMEAPLVQAEGKLKSALLVWDAKQEELRQAEEQRLQVEAQARAEALTLDAAAAMEREASVTGDEGLRQEAADILEQPVEAPVVSVQSLNPKVQGITYRDNWKAHPTIDVRALAAAVADGSAPIAFLTPNITAINQFAKATQGVQPVSGIKFWNDRQVVARA
jgi:hypothetical protein